MNTLANDTPTPPGSRLRTELIVGSILLAIGLFLVPPVVYLVGIKLLGPYGNNSAGLSTFYGAFFADLASGAPRTWILALGPLLLISLVRLIYIGVGTKQSAQEERSEDEPPPPPRQAQPAVKDRRRVEPRIS